MKTVSCTHKDCTWSKTYPNDKKAAQGLHGHVNRKHGTSGQKVGHKRKYNKRLKDEIQSPISVNFCPCCGCNIRLQNQAMIMAYKMKGGE